MTAKKSSHRSKAISTNGVRKFQSSLQNQNKDLSKREIGSLTNQLLGRMAKYIDLGFLPAVAKPEKDGSIKLIILNAERDPKED